MRLFLFCSEGIVVAVALVAVVSYTAQTAGG